MTLDVATYGVAKAVRKLTDIHLKNERKNRTLANYLTCSKQDFNQQNYKVVFCGEPPMWRLVECDSNDGFEECIFRLVGVVTNLNFPPVDRGGKIGYALQAINITCFDSPCVEHMKKNIMALDDIFRREFVRDRYKRWTPKLFHGNIEISASSRYLTPAKLCPKSRSYTLNVDVDPTDVLNDAIMSGDWKHIDDNRVDYFRWEVDKNKKKTAKPARPVMFNVGDIVEIQVAFVVVGKDSKRLKMVLRSVLHVDSTLREEMDYDAFEVRIAERKRRAEEASNIVRNVRRRVAYDVEEEEEEEEDNMQEVELDVGPLLHRIDAVALNCSTSKSAESIGAV